MKLTQDLTLGVKTLKSQGFTCCEQKSNKRNLSLGIIKVETQEQKMRVEGSQNIDAEIDVWIH